MGVTFDLDLSDLKPALDKLGTNIGRACLTSVRSAIDYGGHLARGTHRFETRTGNLEAHTGGQVLATSLYETEGEIFADTRYASFVDKGTKPHRIEPKTAGNETSGTAHMLRWENDSGVHFARGVNHPGTKPDPFMTNAGIETEAQLETALTHQTDEACEAFDAT